MHKEDHEIENLINEENTLIEEKPRSHRGLTLVWWILIGFILLVGMGLLVIAPYMINKSEEDVAIRIPKDATQQQVTDTLTKYFGDDYTTRTMRLMNIYGFDPVKRHGYYRIPQGATPFATSRKLARGAQDQIEIRFNGFRSLDYLAERMALKMEFSADDFLKAAKDPEYLSKYGLNPDNALALFLDDSYYVYWTSTPKEVLDKIGANYLSFWSEGKREIAEENGLSPADMMIIASIVDDETTQTPEKGRIGRLYINRLDKDMPLQADPTLKFALNDFSLRRILDEHKKVDSPYNTYKHKGLPPGPLRTTSRATVMEILNAQPTTDLFMCARTDGSGFHNFSSTYQEHLKNAEDYHQYLDERNIK